MEQQVVPPLKELLRPFIEINAASSNTCEEVINTIERTTHISEEVKTAAQLVAETRSITTPATPVLRDAALIPAEPLPNLKPVGDAVGVIDTTLQRNVMPSLKRLLGLLGSIVALLWPVLTILKRRREEDDTLRASLHNALSVSEQVDAKYGDQLPTAIQTEAAALSVALTTARPNLKHLDAVVKQVESGLQPLSPLQEFGLAVGKVMAIFHSIQSTLRTLLSESGKLLRDLNKAVAAFDKYKNLALKKIKDFLKQGGIDLTFVTSLQHKIDDTETRVINDVTKPVHDLEVQAKTKLARLETPIKQLGVLVAKWDAECTKNLKPLQDLLNRYVHAAAHIGIHP